VRDAFTKTTLDFHASKLLATPTVVFQQCPCGQDCWTGGADILATQYDLGVSKLELAFYAFTGGVYNVCATAPQGTVRIATVHVSPRSCGAGNDLEVCQVSECQIDPLGESCQQLIADYCSSDNADASCSLLAPYFRRTAGEMSSIAVRVAPLSSGPHELYFAEAECGCIRTDCGTAPVRIDSAMYVDGVLSASIFPDAEGDFALCDKRNFVLAVGAVAAPCLFDGDAPCAKEASCVTSPGSDACAHELAEYCFKHPEDGGCDFAIPVFERSVAVSASLRIHAAVSSTFSAAFVSDECTCGGSCTYEGADVAATRYVDGTVDLDVIPLRVGVFKLCLAPKGGDNFSLFSAKVIVTGDCAFTAAPSDSPCGSPQCTDMEMEECQLLAAAYCSEHPRDEGCHHLIMAFERVVGKEATAVFHVPEVVGSAVTVTLLPGPCECGKCAAYYTQDTHVDKTSGVVTFPFTPKTVGTLKICAAGSGTDVHVANVYVVPDSCAFQGTQDSPCFAPACADEDSVECMQKVTEYCTTHVDEACALLVYRFAGKVGTPLTITLHTLSPDAPIKFVAAANDCAAESTMASSMVANGTLSAVEGVEGPATNAVDVLRKRGTDLLILDLLPLAGGSYKLCLVGAHPALAHLATIDVATLTCAYELAEPNPCTSIACEDPMSETCVDFTAEYCAEHPEDKGCVRVIPVYSRMVGVATSLSLAFPSADAELSALASGELCMW
jgi:hypothetical protein